MDVAPLRELSRNLKKKVKSGMIPGALCCIVKDDNVVFLETCGHAHREKKIDISTSTAMRLYSNTKSVVAVAMMSLVEEGKLSLDDPVSKYLPIFEKVSVMRAGRSAKRPITIRHLAAHTSGLGYGKFLEEPMSGATGKLYQPLIEMVDRDELTSLEAWCEEVSKLALRCEPGDRWEYGYSTDVLGRVLELVSGTTLDKLLEDRVLGPLGMQHTGFAVPAESESSISALYAPKKTRGGATKGPRQFKTLDDPALGGSGWVRGHESKILSAGGSVGSLKGGLVTTLSDLLRFILMLRNGGEFQGVRILKKETMDLMTGNALPQATEGRCEWMYPDKDPGVGWSLLNTNIVCEHPKLHKQYVVGEYGWGGAAGTHWAILPQQGLAYVCFVPMSIWNATHPVVQAVTAVLHRALKLERRAPASARKRPLESPATKDEPMKKRLFAETSEDKVSPSPKDAEPEADAASAEGAADGAGEGALSQSEQMVDRGDPAPGFPRMRIEEAEMIPDPLAVLDRKLKRAIDSGQTPGLGYAILKDGKLVKANAFGVSDISTKKPWRFDTICRLYSMTKNIAVCGVMCLVEDGLVNLDDVISKYIPAFEQAQIQVVHKESVIGRTPKNSPPKNAITLKHLILHASGLSYGSALGDDPGCAAEKAYKDLIRRVDKKEVVNLEQWCNELATIPLRFEPGKRWEYSYGIDVLGRVIEVASGKRLDEFLQERLLTPLKMDDTGFSMPESKRHRFASFYRKRTENHGRRSIHHFDCVDSDKESLWVEPHQNPVLSAGGTVGSVSGGLVSTINDFIRFCLMLQNNGELEGTRVLKAETVQLMSTNLLPEVSGRPDCWALETAGLGFGPLGSVAEQHADANWFDVPGEYGWGGLAGTAWAVDARERTVVVSFCQVMYELWIDEELRKAVRRALGYFPRGTVAQRRFKKTPELRHALLNPPRPPPAADAAPDDKDKDKQKPAASPDDKDKSALSPPPKSDKENKEPLGESTKRSSASVASGRKLGTWQDKSLEVATPKDKKARKTLDLEEPSTPVAAPLTADKLAALKSTASVHVLQRSNSTASNGGQVLPGSDAVHRVDLHARHILQDLLQEDVSLDSLTGCLQKLAELAEPEKGRNPQRGADWLPAALPNALELLVSRGVCTPSSFFGATLPAMVEMCVTVAPRLFQRGLKAINRNARGGRLECKVTRQEILCIHSLAFFGLMAARPKARRDLGYGHFLQKEPDMLACLLTYIHSLVSGPASKLFEHVDFILRHPKEKGLGEWSHWQALQTPLKNFVLQQEHQRQEYARGRLQAMFVSATLGEHGTALDSYPSEIVRNSLSPETMVLPLIVPQLGKSDAVVVVGAEQFSVCECSKSKLLFLAPFSDPSPLVRQRRDTHLVAFDALSFKVLNEQYSSDAIMRELLKAYMAFRGDPLEDTTTLRAVATGNWGGGGAKGDPELKALLQWAAASEAGRDLEYFSQGLGEEEVQALQRFVEEAQKMGSLSVGRLLQATVTAIGGMKRLGAKSVLARVLEVLKERPLAALKRSGTGKAAELKTEKPELPKNNAVKVSDMKAEKP